MTDQPKSLVEKCSQRDDWCCLRFMYFIASGSVLLSLSACSLIASAAKEGALSMTARSGSETFNLTGELPPDFGVEATIWYTPIKPSSSCETDNIYSSEKRTRFHAKAYEQDFEGQAHAFSFNVPLTYSVGFCNMEISKVDLKIRGRFGDQEWQNAYDDGGLRFVKTLPGYSPEFDEKGLLEIIGKCEWLFQDSRLSLQLDKSLKCKGAGAYLQTEKLANKTVKFKIEVNPEERPYYDETWIKFPRGWKPCAEETKGWIWCKSPPTFKTFKMNGKTCTVYPNCTE